MRNTSARLAADIGGTFTDVVLEVGETHYSTKVLTTHSNPADAILAGIDELIARASVTPQQIDLVLHGTTLGCNALIERRGAKTAFITTAGFRDTLTIAKENRFEQYDIFMQRPEQLVPRHHIFGIGQRTAATGEELLPLDEEALKNVFPLLAEEEIESVAIGYLHSYINPAHEQRTRELLLEALPDISVTLSSDVSPEVREYERFSTTCANAYIQPLMSRYLLDLTQRLKQRGINAPLLMMLSNGGLCTVETAVDHPIGLVESGPAGGANFAQALAEQMNIDDVLSFDMGGTTAKMCLLPNGEPLISREFEIARRYRFLKGSGLPLRIPVVDLVEIGAGGGSIAGVDTLDRIQVGPRSASSEPGPACYGLGGTEPTVSDASAATGRLAGNLFAGGKITLDAAAARQAIDLAVGQPLGLEVDQAGRGILEIVDENMASAARIHAIERGHNLAEATMAAFGGAAPLHACQLACRLKIDQVIIPEGAGVGSARGFLSAPIANEMVRTQHMALLEFDPLRANQIIEELSAKALELVRSADTDAPVTHSHYASMRYVGQGYEIDVRLPAMPLDASGGEALMAAFEAQYRRLYGNTVPNVPVEVITWRTRVSTQRNISRAAEVTTSNPVVPPSVQQVFDSAEGRWLDHGVYIRSDLRPGDCFPGPALVLEQQTTTVVTPAFDCDVSAAGHLVLTRKVSAENRQRGAAQ